MIAQRPLQVNKKVWTIKDFLRIAQKQLDILVYIYKYNILYGNTQSTRPPHPRRPTCASDRAGVSRDKSEVSRFFLQLAHEHFGNSALLTALPFSALLTPVLSASFQLLRDKYFYKYVGMKQIYLGK